MTSDTSMTGYDNRIWPKVQRTVANPKRAVASLCQRYLDAYNGYSYDFFKNGESDLLRRSRVLNPSCVFDVGANVGDWTKIALEELPGSVIHGFELSPSTFKTLTSNVQSSRVKLNNFGLSSEEGLVEYKDYGENSTVNTILMSSTFHDARIRPQLRTGTLRTGDSYCREANVDHIDFLKIDTEGSDHLVLMGFAGMLENKAIRLIQFEYGYANGDAKFLMRDFFEFFARYGYIVGRVRKGPIEFRDWTYPDNDFRSGPNYLAIAREDVTLKKLLSN